jgi:L-aspartate oxidase
MPGNKEFDLLIIGCGISGIVAAITAAEHGFSVAIISKEASLSESNTYYAQGGIATRGEDDSAILFENDIMNAGDNINSQEAVRYISSEGPKIAESFLIDKIGVQFSKNMNGDADRTMEAAHSVRRILHVKDRTGKYIEIDLLSYAEKLKKIRSFASHVAIDLITNTHNSLDSQERYKETKVLGAYVFDESTGNVEKFFAPAVILATGGTGNLYLHTSNPVGATGDGVAMAYRIGAEIINAEFIQFHPTILFHKDVKRFLISESVRGEGARLVNKKGEYFMEKYSPLMKDLAPRDEVSRAIFREMEQEGSEYVLLDARNIKGLNHKERFPSIYDKCLEVGIDMEKDLIPVIPAAHFFCGGIKVNLAGKTSIPGLYSVGEAACTGVHGGNRLASVSLLEGLVFGKAAAEDIIRTRKAGTAPKNTIPDWVFPSHEEEFDPILIHQDMLSIQSTMWNYAGIVRKTNRLERAYSDLNYLTHRIEKFYRQAKIKRDIIELRNSVLAATLIVKSALSNPVSMGCHFIE